MNAPIDPQVQTMIDHLPEKTGKSLAEWYKVISSARLDKHGDMMNLLKGEYGVTHGFANTIALLYRQQASGGPPSDENLIDQQYTGAKLGLRPVYEAVLSSVTRFGSDIEIAPKKTYVSLRRSKQFAIVQATTRTRVDLGLNLKNAASTDRLEGGNVFSGMCTHRVQLTSPADVDADVIAWLKQAYDQA